MADKEYAMKWCDEHWAGLKAEVERQGLSGLIATDGPRAAENLARQIEGDESIDTFDPLMNAHWAMNSFIGETIGPGGALSVLMLDGCPVCKINEVHERGCGDPNCDGSGFERYFINAVDDQKRYWEELNNG